MPAGFLIRWPAAIKSKRGRDGNRDGAFGTYALRPPKRRADNSNLADYMVAVNADAPRSTALATSLTKK